MRERMESVRVGVNHKGVINSAEYGRVKFFLTVNVRKDGRVGEVFVTCDASGSTLDGFCDAWSTALSMLLQHGESVEDLGRKFGGQEFEPKGWAEAEGMHFVKSIPDYVMKFLGSEECRTGVERVMKSREQGAGGIDCCRPLPVAPVAAELGGFSGTEVPDWVKRKKNK
jgi:hypothetical protein